MGKTTFMKTDFRPIEYVLIDSLTILPRHRLNRKLLKKSTIARKTLATLKKERQTATEHGAHSLVEITNIAMYMVILTVDLTALSIRILLEHDELLKNVYCRQLVLLIYEFLDDFPNLFGQRLREILKQLPKGNSHLAEINDIGKAISELRKRHLSAFHKIRIIAVAHRDFDGEKQYDALQELDTKMILDLAYEIDQRATAILHRMTLIMRDYSWSPLEIREIANNIEKSSQSIQ